MSKGSRSLLLSTGIALGAAVLAAATAQAQTQQPQQQQQSPQDQQPSQAQPQLKQGQPQLQEGQAQDFDQLWRMQKQQIRARIAGAVRQLQTACADELHNFCSTVTPGEGRLLLCMQAHEDKISRQCELALLETSRNIGKVVRHIETFAQVCWPDIQVHCSGTGGSVTQCVMDNRASLSPACRAIVAAMVPAPGAGQQKGQQQGQAPQGQGPSMVGLSIYSTDGMMLGEVTGVKRRPDGSLEAIEADLGSPLGLGATSVLISPGDLRWKGDGVELRMAAEQVRSILQGHRR
ncbi:MAG TPA: cysteine rich repeat-containing protein [Hyphomicrobiaceae bacterium]